MTGTNSRGSGNGETKLANLWNPFQKLGDQQQKWWVAILNFIFAAIFFTWGMQFSEEKILDWPQPAAFTVLILLFLLFAFLSFGLISQPEKDGQTQEERQTQEDRQSRLIAGILLTVFAVATYISSIFFVTSLKPWLLAYTVVGAATGTWMLGTVIIGVMEPTEIQKLRRNQTGDSTNKNETWVKLQTNRANWLAVTIVVTLLLSLALYIANHVRVVNESPSLRWQTHLTANEYVTQPTDSLLAAAAALDTDVAQLARANPMMVLSTPITRTSTVMDEQLLLPTGRDGRSLDAIARDLGATPEEVALGFATIELQPAQVLQIPNSGPRLWLDWILWGLVGVGTYLLIQASNHYRKIPEGKGDFINETPWYFTQLLTGPLIAFVVLALLTHIDFSVLGQTEETAISVNLSQLPYDAMFGIAFLFGFFSRVTRKLLELITKSLFGPAWSAAAAPFDIQIKGDPDATRIESGGRVVFTTEPPLPDIEWTVKGDGSTSDGAIYQAPEVKGEWKTIVVTALVNDGSRRKVSRTFNIVPHKYEIAVEGDAVINAGETHLHFVSNTEHLTDEQKKEIYWHWQGKPKALKMVFRAPEASENNASATESDSFYGSDVDIVVKEPLDESPQVEIVASYRGQAVTKTLTVAKRSLGAIQVFKVLDGKDDQLLPSTSPISLTANDKLRMYVTHNLSEDDAAKIIWDIEQGDGMFTDKSPFTGTSVTCKITEPVADGKVKLVAKLPDSKLQSGPLELTVISS